MTEQQDETLANAERRLNVWQADKLSESEKYAKAYFCRCLEQRLREMKAEGREEAEFLYDFDLYF